MGLLAWVGLQEYLNKGPNGKARATAMLRPSYPADFTTTNVYNVE